jgi:hypothetical protein
MEIILLFNWDFGFFLFSFHSILYFFLINKWQSSGPMNLYNWPPIKKKSSHIFCIKINYYCCRSCQT